MSWNIQNSQIFRRFPILFFWLGATSTTPPRPNCLWRNVVFASVGLWRGVLVCLLRCPKLEETAVKPQKCFNFKTNVIQTSLSKITCCHCGGFAVEMKCQVSLRVPSCPKMPGDKWLWGKVHPTSARIQQFRIRGPVPCLPFICIPKRGSGKEVVVNLLKI